MPRSSGRKSPLHQHVLTALSLLEADILSWSISGIPMDMCVEVLSYLPAKEVIRLSLLSKSIRAATRGRHFALTQTRRASANVGVILGHCDGRIQIVIAANSNAGVPPSSVAFLNKSRKHVVGSHGGIIVFLKMEGPRSPSLFLLNPVTRETVSLGRPIGTELRGYWSVGAVPSRRRGGDLDILCLTPCSDCWPSSEMWMYSWKNQDWIMVNGRISVGPRDIKLNRLVLSSDGGSLFVLSENGSAFRCEPYIVSINVCDGSSELLEVPQEVRCPSNDWELELGGPGEGTCLSLVLCSRASEFTVWDVEAEDCWVWKKRELNLSMASMGLQPQPVKSFCLINGDTLVFSVENNVYAYDVNSAGGGGGLKRVARTEPGIPYMCPYANTLQPCV